MTIKIEKTLLNNQSILQNFAFGEEIDEQAAEIISGGSKEVFTISNETGKYDINYYVDDQLTKFPKPGDSSVWTTYDGGIIKFDTDGRGDVINWKKYNLSDGKVYAFRENKSTPDPYDIDLYAIG